MGDTLPNADVVVGYWFDELSLGKWFRKDIELDAQIGQRFLGLHRAAADGELWT
ncbi:DUF924 family protein [Billgrantia montanilacus]|uniref:DUF924 family protein n=1 Tax=Billgrantia montanilacus TaxID=2282305 RepID=UPI0015F036F2|nr:DUF924 family protein [Halomonas montanilacus]